MKALKKLTSLLPFALLFAMVIVYSSPQAATGPSALFLEDSTETEPISVEDMDYAVGLFFEKECTDCRFVTIFDQNDAMIYDGLVEDITEIEDEKLKDLLEKSDFIMRNSITEYYILSK